MRLNILKFVTIKQNGKISIPNYSKQDAINVFKKFNKQYEKLKEFKCD